MALYLGLMSGTSMDSVDVVIAVTWLDSLEGVLDRVRPVTVVKSQLHPAIRLRRNFCFALGQRVITA